MFSSYCSQDKFVDKLYRLWRIFCSEKNPTQKHFKDKMYLEACLKPAVDLVVQREWKSLFNKKAVAWTQGLTCAAGKSAVGCINSATQEGGEMAWGDSKWIMIGNISPVTPREEVEGLVGVGDRPSAENKQSAPASFFIITSGLERATGLQIPSSSSWACCLLSATWRGGKEITIQAE